MMDWHCGYQEKGNYNRRTLNDPINEIYDSVKCSEQVCEKGMVKLARRDSPIHRQHQLDKRRLGDHKEVCTGRKNLELNMITKLQLQRN